MFSALYAVALLAAPLAAIASPHDSHGARHHGLAKRMAGDVERRGGSRWSFYDVGLGACGKVNVASDFIVAMNSDQFDQGSGYPNTNCWKMITMTYKGKTTQAQIVDRCPGCGYGGYDLSRGLFKFFASEDEGIIYGDVTIGGGGAPPKKDDDKPKEEPKPKTTWKPEPTTTWKPEPKPETSKKAETTKEEEKKSSSSSHPPSSSHSSSKASSAAPSTSAAAKANPSGTVESFNEILMDMANLMFAAYKN